MIIANSPILDQAELVKLTEEWANAVRARDVDASVSHYAPNVQLFDVVEPLEYTGAESVRKRTAEWFATFQGPLDFEMHDLRIAADGDVAFSHSLNHVSGMTTKGKLDMWWRATVCYRKMDDRWRITHEHNSVPFNVETGKASLDLKP